MHARKRSERHVVVAIDLSGESGRKLCEGIAAYTQTHSHLRVTVVPHAEIMSKETLRQYIDGGTDGLITSETDAPGFELLARESTFPVVVIGHPSRREPSTLHYVRNDDVGVGRAGASFLLSLGNFMSFAFIPSETRSYWSLLRERGFKTYLRERGKSAAIFGDPEPGSPDSLQEWVRSIPKPAAIMAAYDRVAVDVLDACRKANIDVPKKVAVLGVDDDRILCDFSNPPLSSMRPDHAREGFLAAETLDMLMSGRAVPTERLSRGLQIVERETTATISPATHLVEKGLDYIRANLQKPPTVSDVVSHLHVSRRLADLRFVELKGMTLSDAILSERLKEVKRRLETSDLKIQTVAELCGFQNTNHLANVFRRVNGVSMTAYRARKRDKAGQIRRRKAHSTK